MLYLKGDLNDNQMVLLNKLKRRAARTFGPAYELDGNLDKYAVKNAEVDCGARMHLCHGRCCSFEVRMSRQDLEEGELKWAIESPYHLPRNGEGYCIYQTRETGFCGTYRNRPAACREYSCKDDKRIWI